MLLLTIRVAPDQQGAWLHSHWHPWQPPQDGYMAAQPVSVARLPPCQCASMMLQQHHGVSTPAVLHTTHCAMKAGVFITAHSALPELYMFVAAVIHFACGVAMHPP